MQGNIIATGFHSLSGFPLLFQDSGAVSWQPSARPQSVPPETGACSPTAHGLSWLAPAPARFVFAPIQSIPISLHYCLLVQAVFSLLVRVCAVRGRRRFWRRSLAISAVRVRLCPVAARASHECLGHLPLVRFCTAPAAAQHYNGSRR